MNDLPLERIPPQSLEAEQAVIGACLRERDAIDHVLSILQPEDFYREAHRMVYTAMLDLHARKEPVDLITLGEALRTREQLEVCGGTLYLSQCAANVPSAAGIGHYAGIVRAKAAQRALIRAADHITTAAYAGDRDLDDLLEWAEQTVGSVAERSVGDEGAKPLQTFLHAAFDEFDTALRSGDSDFGLRTPWTALNDLLSPLGPGQLTIIAARPSMGKTAFAMNLAMFLARDCGKPGVVFSMEMEGKELGVRAMLTHLRQNGRNVTNDDLNQFDTLPVEHYGDTVRGRKAEVVGALATATDDLWETPLYIDDRPHLSVQQIDAELRRVKRAQRDVAWFMVDYAQLAKASFRKGASRAEEVGGIVKDLFAVCKQHKIPGFCLSQLSRNCEYRAPKRPQVNDLYESGAIENHAYRILTIYRPMRYGEDECRAAGVPGGDLWTGLTEVSVLKQRGGKGEGRVALWYDGESFLFRDLTDTEYDKLEAHWRTQRREAREKAKTEKGKPVC